MNSRPTACFPRRLRDRRNRALRTPVAAPATASVGDTFVATHGTPISTGCAGERDAHAARVIRLIIVRWRPRSKTEALDLGCAEGNLRGDDEAVAVLMPDDLVLSIGVPTQTSGVADTTLSRSIRGRATVDLRSGVAVDELGFGS
ncbi:hypothetical protein [Actinokineospora sp. HUAS TT18]|uniref:hypothetical protein n=1 Tax=Actinokineospora sp. HUAS TT18 TaxID=3447451 RepID=UPI003F5290D7